MANPVNPFLKIKEENRYIYVSGEKVKHGKENEIYKNI